MFYDENGNPVAGVGGGASPAPVVVSGTSDGVDTSGFLSGLGDLFQGIGAGIGSGLKGANIPTATVPSGWVYNAATGSYYNPATGQALTSTGTLTSVPGFAGLTGSSTSMLFLVALAIGAFLLFRHRG